MLPGGLSRGAAQRLHELHALLLELGAEAHWELLLAHNVQGVSDLRRLDGAATLSTRLLPRAPHTSWSPSGCLGLV